MDSWYELVRDQKGAKMKKTTFEVGKLYKCPGYFLLIYPTKEKALHAVGSAGGRRNTPQRLAVAEATYWSRELKCQVRYSTPGEIFMFLEKDEIYLHVLFGDAAGWIIHETWLDIKEAQNEV